MDFNDVTVLRLMSDFNVSARLQTLAEEKAQLEDLLAVARSDVLQQTKQLKVEQAKVIELLEQLKELRGQLQTLSGEKSSGEAEMVRLNAELHGSEVERERLTLQLQRINAKAASTEHADRTEAHRRELAGQVERMQTEFEQLRRDKNDEIQELRTLLSQIANAAQQEADAHLTQLWQRLAGVKPPLVAGHDVPNVQVFERLVDGFVEFLRFADDVDKSLRVFLDRYTKHSPTVRASWDVYAKREDVQETAKQILAVRDARPVGLLKMKLRVLHSWCQAAMIGSDSAVESIASELEAHLRGPSVLGADANGRIKDFLRADGHYVFLERVRELRGRKLAESFGRAG